MDSSANLFLRYEEKTTFKRRNKKTIPTLLVTGNLGSGKTTLVSHLLETKGDLRVAVAVNDYSEKSFDSQALGKIVQDVRMIDLSKGCICCSLSAELKDAVWELIQESEKELSEIDYLVIESSGVTDPLVVASALDQKFGKMSRIRLDHVVCVVDTEWLCRMWMDGSASDSGLCVKQISSADTVLLNKVDLCTKDEIRVAETAVSSIVPGARILQSCRGKVPLSVVLEVEAVSLADGAISHDPSAAVRYTVKRDDEVSRRSRMKESISMNWDGRHASFTAHTFVTHKPVPFLSFQKHIRQMLPKGIRRIKGEIAFKELPCQLYIFQWSGEGRVDVVMEDEHVKASMIPSLAYISEGYQERAEIEEQMYKEVELVQSSRAATRAKELLEHEPWFEVLRTTSVAGGSSINAVYFRLVGLDGTENPHDVERLYGIDFRAMNEEYISILNGHCTDHIFLPIEVEQTANDLTSNVYAVLWSSLHETEKLDACFQQMKAIAQDVCRRHMGHIKRCSCGF